MTMQTREALGNRIRELRKENRLTQEKLALMVNVERSYLAKLEHGKRNPSIDCIEKIAGGLGVTLSELFKGIEAQDHADPFAQRPRDGGNRSGGSSYFVAKLP